jgi:hypothetical protein
MRVLKKIRSHQGQTVDTVTNGSTRELRAGVPGSFNCEGVCGELLICVENHQFATHTSVARQGRHGQLYGPSISPLRNVFPAEKGK